MAMTPATTNWQPQSVTDAGANLSERKQHVILQIEAIVLSILTEISNDRTPSVSLRSRRTKGLQMISYLGTQEKDTWRFAVVLRILELVHQALVDNLISTKRDIYYKDKALFRRQEVVDRYVDDIAFTFGVQRSCLNVVAAAKGLIVGSFKVTRVDGSVLDGASEHEGMLIPNLLETDSIELSEISWILVIEKEATFRSLAYSNFHVSNPKKKGIITTAKGYPDIATRAFLHQLHLKDRLIPIYALVDWDPDGLAIFSTYANGSKALAHETHALDLPGLIWLGPKSEDVLPTTCARIADEPRRAISVGSHRDEEYQEAKDAGIDMERHGLLSLTARDRKKAIATLRLFPADVWNYDERRKELQLMLMLDVKAEIQALENRGGVESWLSGKLELWL